MIDTTEHNHKLRYNKEQGFMFCEKCGERWFDEAIGTEAPYTYPMKSHCKINS